MFESSVRTKRVLAGAALALTAVTVPARAEDVSEAQILRALTPPAAAATPPRTRGLSLGAPTQAAAAPAAPGAPSASDEAFVDSIRNRPSRGLSLGDREKLVAVAENKPKIDLPMEFDYASDELRGEALANAHNLGKALSSPAMKGQTFVIAGHTDAKGSEGSNQKLSERRADAVKGFLIKTYQIPAGNLITAGYGKTHLKNTSDPFGRENRRVQAVNMLQVKTAGR